mgnify:CR=1 FL=1
MLVLSAMGLILLRVGLPVVALVAVGLLIDRWQTRRMEEVQQQYATGTIPADITADATLPGSLGSFGYDDEGTPAHRVDIVKDGIWVGVLSGRDTAHLAGLGLDAERWDVHRPPLARATADIASQIPAARRRLCLGTERDEEIAAGAKSEGPLVDPHHADPLVAPREAEAALPAALRSDLHPLEEGQLRFETQHRRKDGSFIDLEVSAAAMPGYDGPTVAAFGRDITDRKRADTFLKTLNEAALSMERRLKPEEIFAAAAEKVRVFGIELLDIRFKRINYNDSVRPKIYDRMISERRQIAERFLSEGNGEAARIRGNRVRELNRIQSEAYRQVEGIRGVADAKATEIYARAYNQSPQAVEFYEFTRTMRSYESIIAANTTLVLSTDSDLFKFLKGMASPSRIGAPNRPTRYSVASTPWTCRTRPAPRTSGPGSCAARRSRAAPSRCPPGTEDRRCRGGRGGARAPGARGTRARRPRWSGRRRRGRAASAAG